MCEIKNKGFNIENFLKNETIKKISKNKRWTTSDNKKRPVDIVKFLTKSDTEGLAYGEECLCDANLMINLLDKEGLMPMNMTYFIDAFADDIMVIDVEPKCPNDIKEKFLKSDFLYAEVSNSGKGLHLIVPFMDDIFEKYPNAIEKPAIKHEKGWYEILLSHYVLFTTKEIEKVENPDKEYIKNIVTDLAKNQKNNKTDINIKNGESKKQIDEMQKELEKIINYREIQNMANQYAIEYNKTISDFDNDMSRYEFGMAAFIFKRILKSSQKANIKIMHEYTITELISITAIALKTKLVHREKHDTKRNGMDFLYYRAYTAAKGILQKETMLKDETILKGEII